MILSDRRNELNQISEVLNLLQERVHRIVYDNLETMDRQMLAGIVQG